MSEPATVIEVILADDHPLVREGIKALIAAMAGIDVVAEADDGQQLLQLLEMHRPHVVLSDITMPLMDGMAAIAQIRARYPDLPVLALSMHDELDFVRRAVQCGASGYVMKNAHPAELEQAIRSAAAARTYFSTEVSRRLLDEPEPQPDELTPRQLEILRLIAQGLSTKQIGYELGLSPKTVDVHRSRIMDRLDIRDVAGLTRFAMRKGYVRP
jgi:DNA-binding NarL/FixJ family response regulator